LCFVLVERNGIQATHVDEHTSLPKIERRRPTITTILGDKRDALLGTVLDLGTISISFVLLVAFWE
jgi:hypothetical protein